MPTVRGGNTRGVGQSHQAGYHDKDQMKRSEKHAFPRDDLDGAFAGEENEGKFSREKHSTNVKSRNRKAMTDKTPKM